MDGELERRIARLRRGDHLCLIYHSAAEQAAALVPFLKAGLAAGERGLFIGHSTSARRLERALENAGVDVEAECDRGAFVFLTRREDWLPHGRFDPGAMMDHLRQAEQQALDDGFSGLRATWNMGWILEGTPGADRLVEYEAHLNRFLAGSRTSALCRYSRASSPAALIQDALHTHPLAVVGGQICPNTYYEPPEMVLGDRSPEDRIDWMMAQIRRARVSEQKLEEVSLRLSQKRAALERADRAKEDLLSMLAHELRNPLGTISNALQVLRMKGEGDETGKRAIEAAERQVLHQAMLIDNLLEASRVTRGEVELQCEELDLAQLVRETVKGYRGTVKDAGIALDLQIADEPLPVRGDHLRLSQALSNLLDNAAKFTDPGGRITVRASRGAEGKRAVVSVRDNGAGIEPEELPYVFEVFTQGDHSLDRSMGGLGVGLAVVKGLIEMHGGEVRARSEGPGKGAELTFQLPLEPAAVRPAEEPELEPVAAATPGSRKILLVEDNLDAAATMRDFLELSGHEVELAASGADGVQAARQFHPEVVLCDLGLPGMSGFEVAAELRRDPATRTAKLIAVTGYGREEDRRKSKEAGFDLHLTKPVDPIQLRALLEEQPGDATH
ncbi:MAG TPA: MEDS domain-containing protein [Thermoanaerobaculia bacterium]|nr:MEDS domain-containing protein [Thermoanaerobaculia bacterium]